MWSSQQAKRLAIEKKVLEKRMPQFRFYDPTGATYVQGWQDTSHGRCRFELKVTIPSQFPNEMPRLYVTTPRRLSKHGGGTINGMGLSHDFHTFENGPVGCVQICHDKPETWTAAKTLIGVFIKAMLWLELYELHLKNGKTIAVMLKKDSEETEFELFSDVELPDVDLGNISIPRPPSNF
jgi:hypothetical protein